MEEFLAFVTIDKWTMLFTWGNLLILYLLMKKFLFKPVKAVIDAREKEVSTMLDSAESDKKEAQAMRAEYTQKLADAKRESEEIVKNAARRAQLKEEEILREAHDKAAAVIERAENQIELEKKKAVNDVKNDVSEMAVMIASKVIERDISEQDHKAMIEKFINEMSDAG